MKEAPLVSVIMGVYNTEAWMLREAVGSILNQDYRKLEFILVDDGSDVPVSSVLSEIKDERLLLLRNERNIGLTKSLNIALRHAAGKYIARMDADDISLPDRISTQVAFMEKRRDIAVCATRAEYFSESTSTVYKCRIPRTREAQQAGLFFSNLSFIHPSTMLRAEFLREHGICYDERYPRAQDYRLWVQITEYGTLHVINKVLLRHRIHDGQVSLSAGGQQAACADAISLEQLTSLMPEATEQEKKKHMDLRYGRSDSAETGEWVKEIIRLNDERGVFPRKAFKSAVQRQWFRLCFDKVFHEGERTYIRPMLRNMSFYSFLVGIKSLTREKLLRKQA